MKDSHYANKRDKNMCALLNFVVGPFKKNNTAAVYSRRPRDLDEEIDSRMLQAPSPQNVRDDAS